MAGHGASLIQLRGLVAFLRRVHTTKRYGRREGGRPLFHMGGSFLGKGCAGFTLRLIQVRVLAPPPNSQTWLDQMTRPYRGCGCAWIAR